MNAVDSSDNLYVLVGRQGALPRVDPSGTITVEVTATVVPAGLWGESQGVAVDSAGRVYVADQDNRRVLRIDKSGAITAVVGLPMG